MWILAQPCVHRHTSLYLHICMHASRTDASGAQPWNSFEVFRAHRFFDIVDRRTFVRLDPEIVPSAHLGSLSAFAS